MLCGGYVGLGALHSVKVRGKSMDQGWRELIPHQEQWQSLASLVSDGWTYSSERAKQRWGGGG